MQYDLTILFFLKKGKRNKAGEAPIYCRITVNGTRTELSTNERIEFEKWDSGAQKVKERTESARTMNNHFDSIKNKIRMCFNALIERNEEITAEILKNELTGKNTRKYYLVDAFELSNQLMEKEKGSKYSDDTIKRYKLLIKQKLVEMDNNMTLVKVYTKPVEPQVEFAPVEETSDSHFMAANTKQASLEELSKKHTIPVFAKDNESTVSYQEFIQTVSYVADQIFGGETILRPAVRVSHAIKGRIPSAVGKPAKELQEHEKTLYFERMAFAMEIPSISDRVADNGLNLTIGGVRAYNLTNLHSRKSEEHFKLFIGFQNKVCTNLCISTDGFMADVKVRTPAELAKADHDLFGEFNVYKEIEMLNNLPGTMITESQFAQIIGRARLYQNMPYKDRKELPQFPLLDSQVNLVVKDYYSDESFCRNDVGNINLWKLFNLFTGANKMSYIDSFLDRGVGCQQFVNGLYKAIGENKHHWFVN